MTTRAQRPRLKSVADIDALFDDAFAANIWSKAFPKEPLPADFPPHVRSSVRGIELASVPSQGEMGLELRRLHDRLIPAIELGDHERAAGALEQTPKDVLDEWKRHVPGQVPSPDDIRRKSMRGWRSSSRVSGPMDGIALAKELLGDCVSGAEIVPGRQRPTGRQSRDRVRILPRYKQRRGQPRQEAERMLVRALAEYFYNRDGKFPGLMSHGGQYAADAGPFAQLVADILERCGLSSVNPIKLVQRCLFELPTRHSPVNE